MLIQCCNQNKYKINHSRFKISFIGVKRYVTVYKRSGSTLVQKDAVLSLDQSTRQHIADMLDAFPITSREKDELNSCCERERTNHVAMGNLSGGVPQVPSVQYTSEILTYKKNLPIFGSTEQIMNMINSNQVGHSTKSWVINVDN